MLIPTTAHFGAAREKNVFLPVVELLLTAFSEGGAGKWEGRREAGKRAETWEDREDHWGEGGDEGDVASGVTFEHLLSEFARRAMVL